MADFYKELSDLGEWLYNVSQINLSLAYDGIDTYNDTTQLDRAYDSLDTYSQLYNDEVDYLNSVAQELKSHGISTS